MSATPAPTQPPERIGAPVWVTINDNIRGPQVSVTTALGATADDVDAVVDLAVAGYRRACEAAAGVIAEWDD
jgi:hypothetical protein